MCGVMVVPSLRWPALWCRGTLRPPAYAHLHLHTRAKDSAQTVKPDVCRCAAVKKKHIPSSAISTINFERFSEFQQIVHVVKFW